MRLFLKIAVGWTFATGIMFFSSISHASSGCIPWNSARQIIKNNQLLTASEVRKKYPSRGQKRLIELKLCKRGGRYVYKIVMMYGGKVSKVDKIVLDAKSGSKYGFPAHSKGAIRAGVSAPPKTGFGVGIFRRK